MLTINNKHMGLEVRKPDFVACKQQRPRPACASAQFDHCLYHLLSIKCTSVKVQNFENPEV